MSKRPLIYLASPFTDPSPEVQRMRFIAVSAFAAKLTRAGHLIFSPVVASYPLHVHGGLPGDSASWREWNLDILARCDEFWVYCMAGWDLSSGINVELIEAQRLLKPIKYLGD